MPGISGQKEKERHVTTTAPAAAGIRVLRAAGHLGAGVDGISLGDASDAGLAALRAALLEHQVLFLHGQDLDHAGHVAFARRWGDITRRPPPHRGIFPPGFPQILTVDPQAEHDQYGTDIEEHLRGRWTSPDVGWHSDLTPAVNPPSVSILRAEAVPSYGGDTQWASMTAAYAGLSAPLQDLACELRAEHAFFAGCQMDPGDPLDARVLQLNREHPLAAVHPVVRVIPETGSRALFVNPASTSRILGLSAAESRRLLALFFEQATRPEYTVRHRWQPGDVVIYNGGEHAALYAGNGRIVQAPHTGDRVRYAPLHSMPILTARRL